MGLADWGGAMVGYGYSCFGIFMGFCKSMVGCFGRSVSWPRWCYKSDWKVLGLGGGCVVDDGGGKLCLKMTLVIQLIKTSLGAKFWRYFIII